MHFICSTLPCPQESLFGRCHDQRICFFDHPRIQPKELHKHKGSILPPPLLVNSEELRTWHEEAYKAFFKHNIFIFNAPGGDPNLRGTILYGTPDDSSLHSPKIWSQLRDPFATRILEFADHNFEPPIWTSPSPGFPYSKEAQSLISRNRKYIEHMVIHVENPWAYTWEPDWDWPMKIK